MQVEITSRVVEETGERSALSGAPIYLEERLVQVKRPEAAVALAQERKSTWALFGKAKEFAEANNASNLKGLTAVSKEDVYIEVPLFHTEWHTILKKRSAAQQQQQASTSEDA